jgi:serine/threonine protein kinase
VIMGTAGKGGMGTVHIAKDTELLRRVALKQLNAEVETNAGARSRFLREVQITAQLDHPNIVPVYALEIAPGGAPAYTMKFVEGTTFHALLNEAREIFENGETPDETRSLAARLEHFLKVCDAMAYAHDKGVIHRDLKPANLMLGRHNEVYVMDWGLCRVLQLQEEEALDKSMVMSSPDASGSASETQIGDVVGTPKYMSPEQAQGHNQQLDARSDQCALGLILYEMVTLNPPFEGRTAYDVLANAATAKRRPVVHAYLGKRRIPRDLIAIIDRATAFKADDRYASVADFAADIRRYLRGDAVLARPDSLWQRMQRSVARNRQRVLTGILALIALAAIAIGSLLWENQRQFKAERLREQRILALTSAVTDVSDRVQMRLLQLEGAMVNLADSMAQILEHGQSSDQRYYLSTDFADPARAPAGLIRSATHGGMISLQWPVWVVPAALDQKQALAKVRRLVVLDPFMRDIYMRAAQMIKNGNVDFYAGNEIPLSADSSPLNAILVALDDGIAARYPGWDGIGPGYDARARPWYKLGVGKRGPQWGDSYASAPTKLLELPLSIPMYGDKGAFLGVVSAAFLPDLLVKTIFTVKDNDAVRAMYLLDAQGHILAATGDAEPVALPAPDTVVTQLFALPEVVAHVKSGQTGVLEATLHGEKVMVAFDEVTPFGWSVVAVADAKRLLKESGEQVPAN